MTEPGFDRRLVWALAEQLDRRRSALRRGARHVRLEARDGHGEKLHPEAVIVLGQGVGPGGSAAAAFARYGAALEG